VADFDFPLDPWDRYALIGKTGCGKTSFATMLCCSMIPVHYGEWECHWLDTKGDPADIKRLLEWQFIHVDDWRRDVPRKYQRWNRIYWPIREKPEATVVEQSQTVIGRLLARSQMRGRRGHSNVLIVIDEYVHVVLGPRNPGRNLHDAFKTGRGRRLGIIGCTQEPVYVPRQLMSQAGHAFLFDLHLADDIKKVQGWHEGYERPTLLGDKHGVWHSYLDDNHPWRYYSGQRAWYDLHVAPREAKVAALQEGA